MIKASIVIAAYNVAPYFKRCVSSVLDQSEESIEVIIVNDGSTDETARMADKFADIDHRVRVIHQENQGLSAARNSGLQSASGEFICFLDGDDWAESQLIKRMLHYAETTFAEVTIAGFQVDYHDSHENLQKSVTRQPKAAILRKGNTLPLEIIDHEFINMLGYAWNKLYQRRWLMHHGDLFEPNLRLIEDMEFNSRVLAKANTVALIPGAYVHYIQRPKPSLGKARDASFLRLKTRAICCVDNLLIAWNVPRNVRDEIRAFSSVKALRGALHAAAATSIPLSHLKSMLQSSEGKKIIKWSQTTSSRGLQYYGIIIPLKNEWYSLAVAPFIARNSLQKIIAKI